MQPPSSLTTDLELENKDLMDIDHLDPSLNKQSDVPGNSSFPFNSTYVPTVSLDSASESMNHLPWVEKYRPTELSELVSQKHITATIMKFINEKKLPHLLFYGPPGTGKTSTILACAKKWYGPRYKNMILELNASDDRGIDVVRDQIKTFASTQNMFSSSFKLIILDEADSMTQIAQAALRRIIEKYSSHVRFCILCNYISKLIPALQSRCTRFRFHPIDDLSIQQRLETIAKIENLELRPDGLSAILKLSQGDMRRALNILQSSHAAFQIVDEWAVHATTASPLPKDIESMVVGLLNDDFTTAFQQLHSLCKHKGYALTDVITHVFQYVMALEMPNQVKIWLYEAFAEIEYRLSQGCSDKTQLGALVGVFRVAMEQIQPSFSTNHPNEPPPPAAVVQ